MAGGRLLLVPAWPSKETSADAILDFPGFDDTLIYPRSDGARTGGSPILESAGGRRMTPEEFDQHFGDLPTDGEG